MARGRKRKNGDDVIDEFGDDGMASSPNGLTSNRAETIREACQTISELERQVAGLRAEIKAVKETRIKAELNMKVADFNLAYKLYQIEHSERDSLFDTMRECFSALGVGEQLNWLDAAGVADLDPKPEAL